MFVDNMVLLIFKVKRLSIIKSDIYPTKNIIMVVYMSDFTFNLTNFNQFIFIVDFFPNISYISVILCIYLNNNGIKLNMSL